MRIETRDKKIELSLSSSLFVARTVSDLQTLLAKKTAAQLASGTTSILDAQSDAAPGRKKKKINIPITDVTIDEEYATIARAPYKVCFFCINPMFTMLTIVYTL